MLVLPRRTLFFGYTIRKNKDDLANTTYKYKTQYRGVNCIQLNTGGDGHTGNDTGGGEQTQKGRDRHSIGAGGEMGADIMCSQDALEY